jgi:DNA modification methylase
MGLESIPVILADDLSDTQIKAFRLLANRSASWAEWDDELLALELQELAEVDFDCEIIGFDETDLAKIGDTVIKINDVHSGPSLSDRFMIPPFSILSAREGWWQERKRAWNGLGLKSDVGRDGNITYAKSSQPPGVYARKNKIEKALGHDISWDEFLDSYGLGGVRPGTSIFDPVLAEVMYRWFSPPDGTVLDPFAGGSVRGVVAARLGRRYVGIDIRSEQCAENLEQAKAICQPNDPPPVWITGDSCNIGELLDGTVGDFVFSCPSYADLERYSNDPADLSTMDYPKFLAAYEAIISKTFSCLHNNRFAAFVVGEMRDKKGNYRNVVGDTIAAFTRAGFSYYNEIILVTQLGSLIIRVGKQFSTSRKIGKTHQNILVFVKGDPKKAVAACGDVAVEMDEELFAEAVD